MGAATGPECHSKAGDEEGHDGHRSKGLLRVSGEAGGAWSGSSGAGGEGGLPIGGRLRGRRRETEDAVENMRRRLSAMGFLEPEGEETPAAAVATAGVSGGRGEGVNKFVDERRDNEGDGRGGSQEIGSVDGQGRGRGPAAGAVSGLRVQKVELHGGDGSVATSVTSPGLSDAMEGVEVGMEAIATALCSSGSYMARNKGHHEACSNDTDSYPEEFEYSGSTGKHGPLSPDVLSPEVTDAFPATPEMLPKQDLIMQSNAGTPEDVEGSVDAPVTLPLLRPRPGWAQDLKADLNPGAISSTSPSVKRSPPQLLAATSEDRDSHEQEKVDGEERKVEEVGGGALSVTSSGLSRSSFLELPRPGQEYVCALKRLNEAARHATTLYRELAEVSLSVSTAEGLPPMPAPPQLPSSTPQRRRYATGVQSGMPEEEEEEEVDPSKMPWEGQGKSCSGDSGVVGR
ncbi:unnamed protein product, partial [Choristocarpus tenellus]